MYSMQNMRECWGKKKEKLSVCTRNIQIFRVPDYSYKSFSMFMQSIMPAEVVVMFRKVSNFCKFCCHIWEINMGDLYWFLSICFDFTATRVSEIFCFIFM